MRDRSSPHAAAPSAQPSTTRRDVLAATGAGLAGAGLSGLAGTAGAAGVTIAPLARDGNQVVDPQGEQVTLRGVEIADPAEQARDWRGMDAEAVLDVATAHPDWSNTLVRVPLRPQFVATGEAAADGPSSADLPHGDAWGPVLPGTFDASTLEAYLDGVVDGVVARAAENGAYVQLVYDRHHGASYHERQTNLVEGHVEFANRDGVDPAEVWDCSSTESAPHTRPPHAPSEDFPTRPNRGRNADTCGERGMLWHAADQKQHLLDLVEEQSPWEWFTGAEEPTADLDYSYEGLDDIWLEPDEACQALDAEVELFWRVVADRYADRDNVVFDLYDRPAGPFAGDWGGAERPRGALQLRPGAERFELTKEYAKPYYDLWRERSQSWVLEAEDNGQGQLLVLGSPQYSQYTYWAPYNEHDAENVCYSASVQLQDSLRPLEHVVGCPSEYVPVFVTNVGWQDFTLTVPKPWLDRDLPGIDWATGDADPTGGYSFSRFFDEADVHPICATFDHTREPIFFEHGDPSVAGGGARGSDHWYDDGYLLEEATPGGWWQEFVNARETHVSSGDEPYPDADPGPNSLHGLDPVPAGSAGPYGDHDPAVDDGPTPGCLSSDGGDPDDRQGPTCAGQPVNATATVDGRTVCDVDGDELYRDVNADGEVTQTDVVEFFRVQHREAWKRPELFDFSGNDAVDHGDVVALFEHVSAQGL